MVVIWAKETSSAPATKGGLWCDGKSFVFGSRARSGQRQLVAFSSPDGQTWTESGIVTTDPSPKADLGDGNAIRLPDGRIWVTFRRNHTGPSNDYVIEVAESLDRGATWKPLPVVEHVTPVGPGPSRGLWAPFLFLTAEGKPQCYFDDEYRPSVNGKPGHQWVSMKTWTGRSWENPVVVAREPKGLSRDGMATVVETSPGKLLCVVEAVRAKPPHAGILRGYRSADGGKTWGGAFDVYRPKEPFHAFAPSMVGNARSIVLTFATNEDRTETLPTGNPPRDLRLNIKSVVSNDGGKTWTPPNLVYSGTNRNYLPSLSTLRPGEFRLTFLDFDRGPRSIDGHLANISN